MLKVVIPENIPSLNKGEAAILEGIVTALAPLGNVLLTLFSPSRMIVEAGGGRRQDVIWKMLLRR